MKINLLVEFNREKYNLKNNESQCISLFVVSESIKKLFSNDYANIYIFSIFFFNRFFTMGKCGVSPHCSYRDSLTNYKSHICKIKTDINFYKYPTKSIHEHVFIRNYKPVYAFPDKYKKKKVTICDYKTDEKINKMCDI